MLERRKRGRIEEEDLVRMDGVSIRHTSLFCKCQDFQGDRHSTATHLRRQAKEDASSSSLAYEGSHESHQFTSDTPLKFSLSFLDETLFRPSLPNWKFVKETVPFNFATPLQQLHSHASWFPIGSVKIHLPPTKPFQGHF